MIVVYDKCGLVLGENFDVKFDIIMKIFDGYVVLKLILKGICICVDKCC